jgi:hypothetical protein
MHMRPTRKFNFETGRVPRKPRRTIKELADEFGISAIALGRYMKADPNGPRAELDLSNSAVRNRWYDPTAVRGWWLKRRAST